VASHSLRHTIAVHSLEEGFSLEYVADLLGHTSIRSTAVYAKITSRVQRHATTKRLRSSACIISLRPPFGMLSARARSPASASRTSTCGAHACGCGV
jgi:hypothetical protein